MERKKIYFKPSSPLAKAADFDPGSGEKEYQLISDNRWSIIPKPVFFLSAYSFVRNYDLGTGRIILYLLTYVHTLAERKIVIHPPPPLPAMSLQAASLFI